MNTRHLRFSFKILALGLLVVLTVPAAGCSSSPASPPVTPTAPTTVTATTTPTTKPATPSTPPATAQPSTPPPAATPAPSTPTAPAAPTYPATFYTPTAKPYQPTGAQLELFQYLLSLINKDRQDHKLPPVELAFNAATQQHAQDMFDNYYSSHWGTDGVKPYMRYTVEGGLSYEGENSAYSGWYNKADDAANYDNIDVRQELAGLENSMMYDDAGSNWGHRDTILNKWAKKVSLGIVYDQKRLAFVEQFEGDYLSFYTPPTLSGSNLSLSGKLASPDITIHNVSITYDPLPQTLTNARLTGEAAYTDGYGLGPRVAYVIPPPPPGQQYGNLPPEAVQAGKWDVNEAGQFTIQASISKAFAKGKGVYTVVVVATIGGETVNLTNYSLFVR